MSDPKLPNIRRDRPHSAIKRNEWLAADRKETWKSVGVIIAMIALLAAGIWLIVTGLSH